MEERYLARVGASALRLAATATLRSMVLSQGWGAVSLTEGQVHPGDPPRKVDYEAHETFSSALFSHLAMPQLLVENVFGEENIPSNGRITITPGHRAVLLDPLDGSTQWSMIRAGYCVAAMMLNADADGRISLESSIVATPVHTFTLVHGEQLRFGATNGTSTNDLLLTSCLPESTSQEPSLALTGYKIKDRGSLTALMKQTPGWAVLTLGGNPVTPYVVAGDLTAAITWRPQSTWDAIGILMASETDAVVGAIDGTLINGPDFAERFSRAVLTQNVSVIPPMVVAKTRQRFDEIVEAMDRARSEFGIEFGFGLEELA